MTIDQIKTAADTNIRVKTAANSVTRDEVADLFDNLADEQLARGVAFPNNTTALSALSGANYKYAMVPNKGTFEYLSSGTANGSTIYAAAGGGVWSLKVAIPDISTKQDTLVSGTNIKSLNGQSLLGSGNLSLVLDDEIEEYANLAAFPGTGASDIYYVALDTNLLYRWSGSVYVVVGGGSGGSQTLDQVLGTGNTTDDKIVFDVTLPSVGASGSQTKEWFLFKPLIKSDGATNYDVDFAFRQSSINFSGVYDNIMIWGWNIGAGGGLEKSSVEAYANLGSFPGTGDYWKIYRANNTGFHYNWNGSAYELGTKRGRTGIGFSLESKYDYAGNGDMKTESHQFYVDALGIQHRISSYEITTGSSNIGHYRTVSGESLRLPGSTGQYEPDITYWSVTPGAFGGTDPSGTLGTSIQSATIDYSGTTNMTTILGTNMNGILFSGYSNVYFSNATINNAVLANNVTMPNNPTFSVGVNAGYLSVYDNTDVAKSGGVQVNGTNLSLEFRGYGGVVNELHFFPTVRYNGLTNLYWNEQFRFYSDNTNGYLMSNSDLQMNLGGAPWGIRYNTAAIKTVYGNQYYVNTGSSNPSTSNIESGMFSVWKNTTNNEVRLWANDGGTMKSVALS